jgi:hypothetical protein
MTKSPMTIDFIVTDGGPANSVQLGIIEVTGDTIRRPKPWHKGTAGQL